MAKKSVFNFEIENLKNKEKLEEIIKKYLDSREFEYNYENKLYVKIPGKINKAAYATTAVVGAVLGKGVYIVSFPLGFEYYFKENNLQIKAYLLSKDFKRTQFIHSKLNNSKVANNYLNDLKSNLFVDLEGYSNLTSVEIEKIEDKTGKIISIIGFVIFIICLIIIFSLL